MHRLKKLKKKEASINKDNVKLQLVPSFKYLGLILDFTLNNNQHNSSVIRTVLHKMILLAKKKKYLNGIVATMIYKSMLLPYFADVIISKFCNKDLKKLQILQNKCVRKYVSGEKEDSTLKEPLSKLNYHS